MDFSQSGGQKTNFFSMRIEDITENANYNKLLLGDILQLRKHNSGNFWHPF